MVKYKPPEIDMWTATAAAPSGQLCVGWLTGRLVLLKHDNIMWTTTGTTTSDRQLDSPAKKLVRRSGEEWMCDHRVTRRLFFKSDPQGVCKKFKERPESFADLQNSPLKWFIRIFLLRIAVNKSLLPLLWSRQNGNSHSKQAYRRVQFTPTI